MKLVIFPFMKKWNVSNRIAFLTLLAIFFGTIPVWLNLFIDNTIDKEIYRLRVTVTDPHSLPLENAQVWSSVGGEPKKVAGGWQFDIPVASKPRDGKLTIFASQKSAFLTGKQELQLSKNYNPTITIKLQQDTSATVRGIVLDAASGRALLGALVSIVGFGEETVRTGKNGNFFLPAHAAKGQQVQLHVEKRGYRPVNQWDAAGNMSITIFLDRR